MAKNNARYELIQYVRDQVVSTGVQHALGLYGIVHCTMDNSHLSKNKKSKEKHKTQTDIALVITQASLRVALMY